MLESLDKINVKNLVLEEPRENDVDLLAGTEIERIQKFAEAEFSNRRIMLPYSIVFPDRESRNVPERLERSLLDQVVNYEMTGDELSPDTALRGSYYRYLMCATGLRILFPDTSIPHRDRETWEGAKKFFQDPEVQKDALEFFERYTQAGIVFPEYIKEITIPESVTNKLQAAFDDQKNLRRPNSRITFVAAVASSQIPNFPRPDHAFLTRVSKDIPHLISSYLGSEDREHYLRAILEYAAGLKMFQAEKIHVTENGIELEMPWQKMEKPTIPPYPELERV